VRKTGVTNLKAHGRNQKTNDGSDSEARAGEDNCKAVLFGINSGVRATTLNFLAVPRVLAKSAWKRQLYAIM